MPLDPGVIAEFKVQIDASTDKMQREMRQLKSRMYRDGKETASIFNNAFTRNFGIGLSATAVSGFVKSTLASADALLKQSKQIGVSVEENQKFQFAAQQSGIELAAFNKGLEFLNDNAAQATQGTNEQSKAFMRLGVSVKDANGEMKGTSVLLREVLDGLSKMQNSTDRIAAAKDIFGRAGTDFLNLGSAADLETLMKQRERLGGITTQGQAERAERFSDAASASWTFLKDNVGQTIHGWLFLMDEFVSSIKEANANVQALKKDSERRRAMGTEKIPWYERLFEGLSGNPVLSNKPVKKSVPKSSPSPDNILDIIRQMNNDSVEFVPAPVTGGFKSALGDAAGPWPAAALPPRMEMLNLSVSQNTESLRAATSATEKLREAWSGVELPTSVTGRFNSIPVQPLFDIGPNGPQVTATRPAPAGGMVQHFYHNNFEAPEMAARKYNAQAALVPRAG